MWVILIYPMYVRVSDFSKFVQELIIGHFWYSNTTNPQIGVEGSKHGLTGELDVQVLPDSLLAGKLKG